MVFYFKIAKNIQFLTRKIQKNKLGASFQFHFLCVFLVSENLASKYVQLLILTTLLRAFCFIVLKVAQSQS
jgi:hypothetical protein